MFDDAEQSAPSQARGLRALAEAEAQFAATCGAGATAGLDALHTIIAGYPDLGGPGAGEVTASLFMLLEHLIASGRSDREAVEVHLRALRLMLTNPPDPEATRTLIGGLNSVREVFSDSDPA